MPIWAIYILRVSNTSAMKRFHRHTDEERRKWQDPEMILTVSGLKQGMTFADMGCGRGFFAIPAAKIVGEKGKVLAADVDPESLKMLVQKAKSEGLNNIETRKGKAEEIITCNACADIIFFGQCLHDFDDPQKALQNARKTIKQNGTLINVDWKKQEMDKGPPVDIRFDEGYASGLIQKAGFEIKEIMESGPYHYLIKATPK
jgi:ubiquinone/menaquinone biosynthesis C-methylase UbiE